MTIGTFATPDNPTPSQPINWDVSTGSTAQIQQIKAAGISGPVSQNSTTQGVPQALSNVSVVNIDNGFGAGFVASLINRRWEQPAD